MTQAPDKFTGVGSDPFGTGLLTQLANEFFAESAEGSPPTAREHEKKEDSLDSAIPTGAPRSPGLAGGYPSATPDTHPPVHPALQGPLATGSGQGSGGHDPNSSETYPFGEPRCNGGGKTPRHALSPVQPRGERNNHTDPYWTKNADLGFASEGHEDLFTPDFYFLRGSNASCTCSTTGHASKPWIESIFVEHRCHPTRLSAFTAARKREAVDLAGQCSHDTETAGRNRRHVQILQPGLLQHPSGCTHLGSTFDRFVRRRTRKVRRFIGAADAKEIVFARGTTEAINLLAQTYGRAHVGHGDEILLTAMEHHANIVPWQMLAERTGATLRVGPINDAGELLLEEFAALLGPYTKLVAITQVSNALGTVNPVKQIIAMAHAQGVPVLVDGAQSTPHMPIDVKAMDCDFFTFSGHKIFGPTGIGVLYGKADLLEAMPPWQGGGNMIKDVSFQKTTYQSSPQKFEAGTPAIAEVIGLGVAIDYLSQVGMPAIAAYEHELLLYATDALSSVRGLRPIGTAASKASVLSFVMEGLSIEQVARHLDQHGIAVRAGHHCAQPAVRRYGLEGTVRPSLAFYNTHDEIDALVGALHQLKRY